MKEQQGIIIKRYTPEHSAEWDSHVAESRNGTFLHMRQYMEYHAHRFTDHSLMIYSGESLIALLPGHIKGEAYCSHNGLTYGGLILSRSATAEAVLNIFESIKKHLLSSTPATKLIYKPTPHIYHSYPCEEDLYALFRNNAQLTERKISTVIPLAAPIPIGGRRKLTAAVKNRLKIIEDKGYDTFWHILDERLQNKYNTTPVHSIEEIMLLKNRFPENIKLFCVSDEKDNILGGTLLFITDTVVHMQYSATTDKARRTSALDYLYEHLINNRFTNKRYFDFGISVENGGHYLNNGLIAYKERLGGRAIVYDTYTVNL